MEKRFKIISTDMKYVINLANYHVSHGYKIVKVDTGRVFFIGSKYMAITLERPEADIRKHKESLLERAVEREDYREAIRLRNELSSN